MLHLHTLVIWRNCKEIDNWKVVLIEEEFTKRMFETE